MPQRPSSGYGKAASRLTERIDLVRAELEKRKPRLDPELTAALSRRGTERPVCAWLKQNPWALCHGLGQRAFPQMLVAEFPLGTDFRVDFVGLGPFSGGWSISFIEMEPPGARLFTVAGKAADRLNGAIAQIDCWKSFVERERHAVVRDLSKFAAHRELIWNRQGREPKDHVGWPLYHPRATLVFDYFIVIGRRSELSERDIQLKSQYQKAHGIEILTYDRIADAARILGRRVRPS